MKVPRLIVVVAGGALAACNLSTNPPTTQAPSVGIVLLTDAVDAHGGSALGPVGHFFGGSGVIVPDSHATTDSCVVIPYLADTGAFPYDHFVGLDAGPSLTVQTTQATTQVPQATTGLYVLPGDSVIPFTPGTPVTVTVPGAADQSEVNAFPPLAVSAATAATYTISPIDTAPAADSFHITWTAASGAGSAMVFIANFDTAGLGGTPVPVEMYCSATDTGDVLVPTRVAQTWLKALPGSRGIRSYRWETTIQSTAAAQLVVIAQHNGDVLHIPAASRSEPGSGEDVP